MKTAFLSGGREEARREVYAEPPQEMREKLQITREQVLKNGDCCTRSSKCAEGMVMNGTEVV